MGLVTWLSDHSLAVLLTVSAAFTYWWLWRCRERLQLEHRLAALALAVGHIFIGLFSVKAFAVLEAFDMGAMGNMSLFGGVFFMPLFYWGVAKLAKQKTADVFDVFTICLVFTLMCARLNCMISGCCLGAHIPIEGLTHLRFPTRELELLFYVLLLSRLWRKVLSGSARGMIYPIYMISYGIFRFVTETLRVSSRANNILHISHLWALLSLGIGISVTPMSSVGYRIEMRDTDPFFLANNMDVLYNYTGEGNVTQAKLGFGILLTKRLSVGADMVYYHGRISRYFNTDITSLLSNETFVNAHGTARESISRLGANIGLQYDLIQSDKRVLTFGATYRPRTNLKPTTSRSIYSTSITSDKITDTTSKENFSLPNTFTFGLSYQSVRLSLGLDYSMEQWNNVNTNDPMNGIEFKNNQFGVQYIPNPMDVRHVLNRWSYRLGFRYNDYYMRINGHNVRDKAITLGVGIPIKVQGLSAVNVGVEFGQRGRTADGAMGTRQFRMIRENYIKLSIGLSLFGEDDWFKRFKYQ